MCRERYVTFTFRIREFIQAFMRSIILLAIFLSGNFLFCQTVVVSGLITESSDGAPLPFANVLYAPSKGVTADLHGRYSIDLEPGSYDLKVSAVGFIEQTRNVEVISGSPMELNFSLDESLTELDAVVVTAGRFEQRISDVPVTLEVIRPELLENKSITTMQDAIDQTPGVVIVDNDPQIRASSGYSFGAGSRVMILIDDLPVLSGDVGRPTWSFLPIENVEQIEVIKGASSVLYGSAALSGVINVRTAYPKSEPQTKVSMLGGVYDAPGQSNAKWWDQNTPTFTGADFFHSRKMGSMDLVLGGNWFSNTGYVGPEPIPFDTIASDPLRLGPGGYEHRIRMNLGLRWRNKKIDGLTYGFNSNVMDNRNSSVLAWNNVDSGLYRPYPGTVTRTQGYAGYVDPFIAYITKKGTKHSVRTRLYYLDNQNDNEQANKSTVLHGEYQLQQTLDIA